MAGRLGALVDAKTGKAARRRRHQGRRHTVKLKLTKPDIAHHPELCRLSGPDRAPRLRREGRRLHQASPIGTGPFELVSYDVGQKVVYKRRENGKWWGGEAYLDGVEFIDYGTDSVGHGQRLRGRRDRHQLSRPRPTIVDDPRRPGPGEVGGRDRDDDRVPAPTSPTSPMTTRRCATRCRSPSTTPSCCNSATAMLGTVAENHHVAPIHPEYYELPKMARDPAKAKALMAEAGQADFEHELITVDEDWHKNTGDAIAAPDARRRHQGQAHGAAGLDLLERLDEVSLFDDQLEHAPARRAGACARLSHRRGLERDRLSPIRISTTKLKRGARHRRRRTSARR